MNGQQSGALLLVVGSVVFLAGAALGVPGVFTERDHERRLQLLTERLAAWRAAQPLYALGPLTAAVGIGVLGGAAEDKSSRALMLTASVAAFVGAVSWMWSVFLRGTRVREFAFGRLPAWPFAVYVWLTIAGLALLGFGLVVGTFPPWTGWVTLVADAVFLLGYLWLGDLPPFVFYLLLLTVGVGLA